MKNRRERRQEARENSVAFKPFYEGRVITKAEYDKEVLEAKEKLAEEKAKILNKAKELQSDKELVETV